MLTVSRRSYLMSRPSDRIMRAAGTAAASVTLHALGQAEANARFADLIVRAQDGRRS